MAKESEDAPATEEAPGVETEVPPELPPITLLSETSPFFFTQVTVSTSSLFFMDNKYDF